MAPPGRAAEGAPTIAVLVKGYPRLSETFIAQELLGLERAGLPLAIWALRRPTDPARHPLHEAIRAPVAYLPEYLHQAPLRVLAAAAAALRQPRLGVVLGAFWRDLRRDPTASRLRRLGQAFVLARELPAATRYLHAHYLHHPASVVRYAALLTGRPWTFSAHAKDIWTTPDWELAEKVAEAAWGVTCTHQGLDRLCALAGPDKVSLVYHGLDLQRFPPPPSGRPARDGSDPADPVRLVSVGRLVVKKGFDDLLTALASLPGDLHWRFAHIGEGERRPALEEQARRAGLGGQVAFLGARAQPDVVALLREADLFVLPAKAAPSGDRDGLPNVVMEAASQAVAIVATDFAGIPEFITDGVEGALVPPGDWAALSNALNLLSRDPARRAKLGAAAYERLRQDFSAQGGIDALAARFRASLAHPQGHGES